MRRALKISAWTLGSLLLLLALLLAAVLIAGNTARGRLLIEHMTARLSDGHVRLTGLAGAFPAVIELEQLQLRDAQGVWLTAEHISLHWSPLALLARHVDIESLQLTRLDIERRPVSEPSQKSSSQTSLPRIDLQRLSIGTLALGAELAGTAASFSVQGNMRLISLQDAAAALVAHRSDGPGDYELTLRFDRERMDATLRLEEDAGGPLESLLKYPGLGALAVAASLNGPRGAERVELAARAGELRARASGSLDLVHEAADLAYSLEAPAMTPRPGLSWQRVSLQGRWHGTAQHAAGRWAPRDPNAADSRRRGAGCARGDTAGRPRGSRSARHCRGSGRSRAAAATARGFSITAGGRGAAEPGGAPVAADR